MKRTPTMLDILRLACGARPGARFVEIAAAAIRLRADLQHERRIRAELLRLAGVTPAKGAR
jgi:hypothetical protein